MSLDEGVTPSDGSNSGSYPQSSFAVQVDRRIRRGKQHLVTTQFSLLILEECPGSARIEELTRPGVELGAARATEGRPL